MTSPQKENGYTPIANELFEAFYQCKLLEYERVCVMYIWRKTYGWGKKSDWIANSQFFRETGIPRPHVTRTIKLLKEKNIITSSGNKISINKHYEEWKVEWRVLPHQVTTVTSPGNKVLPHQVPTKERKKLTKDISANALKNMAFRRLPDDEEEVTIDAESGEVVKDSALLLKEENVKITGNLKVLAEARGLPFADIPTQRKKYHEIQALGYTHMELAEEYLKLLDSDYWKEQKRERKMLPDLKSLHSNLKNKVK